MSHNHLRVVPPALTQAEDLSCVYRIKPLIDLMCIQLSELLQKVHSPGAPWPFRAQMNNVIHYHYWETLIDTLSGYTLLWGKILIVRFQIQGPDLPAADEKSMTNKQQTSTSLWTSLLCWTRWLLLTKCTCQSKGDQYVNDCHKNLTAMGSVLDSAVTCISLNI